MKNLIKNIALILVSFIVCLVGAELVLRQTSLSAFSLNRGFLFMSAPSFEMVGEQVVILAPNRAIREAAVFGKRVEYDVVYNTNNLGFVDDIDYAPTEPDVTDIVFLGDSFTSGVGVDQPWIPMLRKALDRDDLALYSFGVTGTGVQQFRDLLNHYRDQVSIDQVNVMAITSDFFRPKWYPFSNKDGVRFCGDGQVAKQCGKRRAIKIFPVTMDTPQSVIVAKTREEYLKANIDKDSNRTWLQRQRLFNVYCDALYRMTESLVAIPEICPQWRLYKTLRYEKNETFEKSIEALEKMQAEFPQVKFRLFHVPQKGDVYAKKYAVDIADDIKATGIEYIPLLTECDWNLPMYHINDGHPNESGYVNLARCMGNYLGNP